jgi:hypothetical protein
MREELGRIEVQRAELARRAELLGALVACYEADARVSESPRPAQDSKATATFNMKRVRDAAADILHDAGGPMHYREIYARLADCGFEIRGKDPARTVGAQLSADYERFYSIGPNTGKWGLTEWRDRTAHHAAVSPVERDGADVGDRAPQREWDEPKSETRSLFSFFPHEPHQLPPFENQERERIAL